MIRDTVLIPNGLNEWNEERYELTGYINNINMANTQALMEFHDKGYAGNIYEYGVKRESVTHWGNTNYYGYDGRGSVSDIMDGNGEVQMYHSYEPDGQTTMRFRSYVKNPYRYNAERVDYIPGIADFQYLRARYYTPDTARFIQQDTVWGKIDVPLSQNLYAYCGNNPLNFVDPSGHYPKEAEEYYKTKIENEVKRMQGILNNNSLGLSERQAIQDQISYLRSTENPDNKTLSVMTGTTVGISIKKATIGCERVDCEDSYGVANKAGIIITKTEKGSIEWYKNVILQFDYNFYQTVGAKGRYKTLLNPSQYTYEFSYHIQEYMQSTIDSIINAARESNVSADRIALMEKYLTPELIMAVGVTESSWATGRNVGTGIIGKEQTYTGIVADGDKYIPTTILGTSSLAASGGFSNNYKDYVGIEESISGAALILAQNFTYVGTGQVGIKPSKEYDSDAHYLFDVLYAYGSGISLDYSGAETRISSAAKLLIANSFSAQRGNGVLVDGVSISQINEWMDGVTTIYDEELSSDREILHHSKN